MLSISKVIAHEVGTVPISFKVTMPDNFDQTCVTDNKYPYIKALLPNGDLLAKLKSDNNGCIYTAVADVPVSDINHIVKSGDVTLATKIGNFIPGCATNLPIAVKDGVSIILGKGGLGIDCPVHCSVVPKPCGKSNQK